LRLGGGGSSSEGTGGGLLLSTRGGRFSWETKGRDGFRNSSWKIFPIVEEREVRGVPFPQFTWVPEGPFPSPVDKEGKRLLPSPNVSLLRGEKDNPAGARFNISVVPWGFGESKPQKSSQEEKEIGVCGGGKRGCWEKKR